MSPDHLELRKEIINACLRLQQMGYILDTYGNVSARVPGGFVITPSRVDYHLLTPVDLVLVSDQGRAVDTLRLPSSELEVHRQIYLRRPDVGAVVHTHSFYATALSCAHETIPVIVEEHSQVVGDEIRCTSYVPAGQHKKLGEEVARTLGGSNGVLLANHGTVSCARTLKEALLVCQVVERVAQMWIVTKAIGKAVPIPWEFVKSERERWLYRYGSAADGALGEA